MLSMIPKTHYMETQLLSNLGRSHFGLW